jgi:hypothetical protein
MQPRFRDCKNSLPAGNSPRAGAMGLLNLGEYRRCIFAVLTAAPELSDQPAIVAQYRLGLSAARRDACLLRPADSLQTQELPAGPRLVD